MIHKIHLFEMRLMIRKPLSVSVIWKADWRKLKPRTKPNVKKLRQLSDVRKKPRLNKRIVTKEYVNSGLNLET